MPHLSSRQRTVTLRGSLVPSRAFTTLLCKVIRASVSRMTSSSFSCNSFIRNWISLTRWSGQQNFLKKKGRTITIHLHSLSFCVKYSFLLTESLLIIILHAPPCFVSLLDQPFTLCPEELRVIQHNFNVFQIGSHTQQGAVVRERHRSPLGSEYEQEGGTLTRKWKELWLLIVTEKLKNNTRGKCPWHSAGSTEHQLIASTGIPNT